MPETPKEYHARQAQIARDLYLSSLNSSASQADWRDALYEARQLIIKALRASHYLTNVALALEANGGHMLAFRAFLAPPISQDQFRLLCPSWSKDSENRYRPVSSDVAAKVASVFASARDRFLTRWIDRNRAPSKTELRRALSATSTLLAAQQTATERRNKLAAGQEDEIVRLLTRNGWTKLPSRLIDTRASVAPKHFMHKTRFATNTHNKTTQEVDVACGLRDSFVLAMECKVTNDETNSVKRINDVLKKAAAWRAHWGNFVVTAALLQGVIKAKEVEALLDAGVEVFWSHDLPIFEAWIAERVD